ncbi:MAG: response regulator [Elusimicrobia bacterium]|nr:response regulator [Elusimicrobiota bacterium]
MADSPKEDAPMKKPLILVVEDSQITQKMIQERFLELGCDLVSCENAEDALKTLRSDCHIDVIILDFNLPGTIKGPALYEKITKDKDLSSITVVPFTSTIDRNYNLKTMDPRDWARVSNSYNANDNATPIVSKGDSEHIRHVPDDLIMFVGSAIRKRGIGIPPPMREVLNSIVRNARKQE